uniref:Fibronectin type-III domain-containing protein n=1 Tax=Amphimedon queenslandica TaxID=400682 RepID=A0A1X7TVY0_AMPQE
GVITNFQCTDEPVCAGDRIECNCTTDTGALVWFVNYSAIEPLMWNQIDDVIYHVGKTKDEEDNGYYFTYNISLNTSILTFNLNESEIVRIECADGQDDNNKNATITDLGYYAKAPTNLTTTFNGSGVTLEWEDTGNNCTSTVYQVTVISCSCTSTSVLTYNTSKTALHINSSDLLDNVTYAYTVRGWNEQESSISEPFTLAPVEVMSITINITNTTDPCKNNSCCVNVTLNIILASLHPNQYYNISLYNSNTGLSSYKINETERTGSELKYNEAYCFTATPMNISTGASNNDTMTTECECQPPGNNCTIATPDFNVAIIANSTTCNHCNYNCCANITISIQLVSNTSEQQYANQRYIISYNDSITGNEESVVTNKREQSKNIQLPYKETYCFTITPVHYFDSGLEKNRCIKISKCNLTGNEPTGNDPTASSFEAPLITNVLILVVIFILLVCFIIIIFLLIFIACKVCKN